MKRKFITNLGFLLFLNLIIKPIYVFGIDRVVQNEVGAEVYGRYFTFLNIAIIFQILLDLGIENFIRREIASRPQLATRYFPTIVTLKLMLLVPYLVLCSGIALMKGIAVNEIFLLLCVLVNQFLASFILFLRANLGGLQLFKTESIVSVLDRTLMILIVGFLLLYPLTRSAFKIEWFVVAQSGAYLVSLIISLGFLKQRAISFRKRIELKQLVPILKQLKPYAALVLLMALYYRSDSIFLSLLLPDGDKQAGIFAHGFRILDFMSNYALLFPILLLPIFSRTLQLKQAIDGLLKLSVLLLVVPSVAALAPFILYRFELFSVLYPEHIVLSANVFAILSVSFIGMCMSYTFGALLTANGNLRELNIMAVIAVVISATLNLILIPRYEVLGAAIANATAQLFTIVVHIFLVKRIFKLKFNIRLAAKLFLYFAFLFIVGYLLSGIDINWLVGTAVFAGANIGFALLIRLISINGLLSIIKQKEELDVF